jgi:hypothetical protein
MDRAVCDPLAHATSSMPIYVVRHGRQIDCEEQSDVHAMSPWLREEMADVWSKRKRSQVMSLIRSSGTNETELRLIPLFRNAGVVG